jgi:hypothetical protein
MFSGPSTRANPIEARLNTFARLPDNRAFRDNEFSQKVYIAFQHAQTVHALTF